MKYLFLVFICLIGLSGCHVTYSQLYETRSTFNDDGGINFENDTVKINYSFWDKAGVLGFSVYNKLDVPIYIDWKKSSFIKKDDKFDYWIDEEKGLHTTEYSSITYKGIFHGVNTEGTSVTNSKTVKPERITFLAPHSKCTKFSFIIYNPNGTLIDTNHTMEYIPSRVNNKKTVGVYVANYTANHNPLTFRNFLTLSTTEKFEKEFYVDNKFYVSKITEMPQFELLGGEPQTIANEVVYAFPYKAANCFYIGDIDNSVTISARKKHHGKAYNAIVK